MSMRATRDRDRVARRPTLLAIAFAIALVHCSAQEPVQAPAPATDHDVAVDVRGVLLDPATDSPIVLLEERRGDRSLPIWIGEAEARSIAVELENLEWPRPNSHDLARRLLHGLEASVEHIVVSELRGSTYFAVLFVRSAGKRIEIDARPSDAIAIALRVDAPIYVREALLERARDDGKGASGAEEERVAL